MPHILGLSSHPLIYSEVLVWYSCLTLEYAGPCLCNDRRRSLGKQVCRSVRHPGLWGELCPGVEHHGAHVCLNASLIRMQEAQCVEPQSTAFDCVPAAQLCTYAGIPGVYGRLCIRHSQSQMWIPICRYNTSCDAAHHSNSSICTATPCEDSSK